METSREYEIIKKIIKYCDSIEMLKKRFGTDFDVFLKDDAYQAAAGMFILQIGELAKNLSDDFILKYNKVPWHQIKGLRNIYAHQYHTINPDIIWDTIVYDCPELNAYCKKILESLK